jgi:hypothetical protein
MKQKDFFENFITSGFGEMMMFRFLYITSKLGHFDVRAIWILSLGSSRFLCFVFMFIQDEGSM